MLLNVDNVGAERMPRGRRFQATGRPTSHTKCPVAESTKSPRAAERRTETVKYEWQRIAAIASNLYYIFYK